MIGLADYVARGWHVLPCHSIARGRCTCAKGVNCESPGKHPRTHNGVKDATTNMDTIRSWEQRWPDTNWAVACGRISGIIVIDIDPRKDGFTSMEQLETTRPDGPLPDTLKSITGGAGRHLFFQYPESNVIGNRTNWLSGVDVKSDGGYVILPPATHVSGGSYTWINWDTQLIMSLPTDIIQMLMAGQSGAGGQPLPDTDDVLKGVPEGQRDDVLFKTACRLRRQTGSREFVTAAILKAASNCTPPFPQDQAMKCVDSAFKQDHTDTFTDWATNAASSTGTGHQDSPDLYNLTDLGNANRFVDNYGEDIVYVDGWGWLVWTDLGWQRDSQGTIPGYAHTIPKIIRDEAAMLESSGADQRVVNAFTKHATKTESSERLTAVTKVARDMTRVRRGAVEFDSEDHLIACRNGMVDLRTGEIRAIDRDDFVTKNTGVLFDPTYRLDAWERFLDSSCAGDQELVSYLQMAAGYTLTGSNAEEVFFLISGPPASGKSTFMDALHAGLGSYATNTQSDTFMYRHNQTPPTTELARLAGMRLVTMSEIREGESFAETLIKQFTGGDKVTARFLYERAFEYRPQFKLWIATNHDPDARDDAMWRRIKKITFPRRLEKKQRDPTLKMILRDPDIGGRAALAWAVAGARRWYEAGGLTEPISVSDAVTDYWLEQDRFGQFISDCLVVSPGTVTPLNDMFATYRAWCVTTNEIVRRQPQFTKAMDSRGIHRGRDDHGKIVFHGVTLRSMSINMGGASWQ